MLPFPLILVLWYLLNWGWVTNVTIFGMISLSPHHLDVKTWCPQRLIHVLQDVSKTLTLIDWGLADDFSGGLARAGKLYLDANGKPPKKDEKAEVPNGRV